MSTRTITNLVYLAIAATAAGACLLFSDTGTLERTTESSLLLILEIAPILVGAMMVGGYFQTLIPHETVTRLLGGQSGLRGLALASAAGAVTPGGPFASFPLAAALYTAGADIGTTVAFVTSWSVINVLRLFVWELPLLGIELSLVRYTACLALPMLAGWLARVTARRLPVPHPGTEDV